MSLTNVSPKCSPAATSVESSSLPTSQKDSMEVNDDFRWARFFRELAGILVLYLNIPGQAWLELLKKVGASQNDLDDVISQDLDPEIQVYKLLNKSKAAHSNTQDWWRIFSREITKVRNDNFSEDVQKVLVWGSPSLLWKEHPHVPPTDTTPCIPKHSQSFEVINEDEVIRSSEEIKSRLKEEIDVEISDPEVSQQIDNVRRVIQDIAGKTQQYQLSLQLAGAASQILKMETSYRATQTLKDILDQENEINKKEKIRLIKENEAQSQEIQSLKQEIEELKKTTADKNLNDFDVITKREAHELAETKKSVPAASATVTVDESNTVNIDAYHNLQARCIKVTKQRDQ
ncbi:putative TNFAIP3-interacting protein 1, partial [Apostichopus japonicus]